MLKKFAGMATTVAFLGAVVVYHEQLLSYVGQVSKSVLGIGTGRVGGPPPLKFPDPVTAMRKGKNKGLAQLEALLQTPEVQNAIASDQAEQKRVVRAAAEAAVDKQTALAERKVRSGEMAGVSEPLTAEAYQLGNKAYTKPRAQKPRAQSHAQRSPQAKPKREVADAKRNGKERPSPEGSKASQERMKAQQVEERRKQAAQRRDDEGPTPLETTKPDKKSRPKRLRDKP